MTAHGTAIGIVADRDEARDLEAVFTAHYARIARVIARLVGDYGRAEELAVDVFLKWWRHRDMPAEAIPGWLVRTAVRQGLDELRRQARREKYGRLWGAWQRAPLTPEDLHESEDERRRVREVLRHMRRRDAMLLLMRAEGFSYEEVAAGLALNPASVGTLISRAQHMFRTEYLKRHERAH